MSHSNTLASSPASETSQDSEHALVITRVFDAPRELVFKAWAEPEQWIHWLGLRGCSGKVVQSARRPPDAYRYLMRDPEGGDHWLHGVYRELVEPERLVFTWGWANEQWQPISPETIVTLSFEDVDGKTRLTLRHGLFESVTACDLHREGWIGSFDRFGEHLARAH
jgi:uncharacterized protein YndB with AHSA1/START domain